MSKRSYGLHRQGDFHSRPIARATRALVTAESRVVAGIAALRAPANDTRRHLLRNALHKAADAKPNRKLRAAIHRDLDDRIEDALVNDPDGEISITDHLFNLADAFHLDIDITKLSDELLGMPPRIHDQPGAYRTSADTDDP